MTDLSHRILKWNNRYFSEEFKNPYVDMVYLACDCANLPILEGSIDMITSTGGFESMQHKMMDGFREAHRVLKQDAHGVYGISLVDDFNGENTKKWMELYLGLSEEYNVSLDKMNDVNKWKVKCEETGYSSNELIKVYGEMPAPYDNIFPFENMVLRWMAQYVVISTK